MPSPLVGPPLVLQAPLRVHAMEWAGQSVADKLAGLRQQLAEAGAGALLVTMLGASAAGAAPSLGGQGERMGRAGRCLTLPLFPTCADEVAWLFNLRGGDVPYNPVFVSYGVVTAEGATLYVDLAKVTPE